MGEKVKNKDAEPEESKTSDLEGLEDTFPGSDPLAANQPGGKQTDDKSKSGQDRE